MGRSGLALLAGAWALAGQSAWAAPPPVEDYGKLPAVEQMRLSPSGDKIAYITVENEARALVVRQVGGPVLIAAAAGSTKLQDAVWLDDDHVLVETSTTMNVDPSAAVSKIEVGRSTMINLKTRKALKVFDGQAKILHATYGYFGHSTEGARTFAYFGAVTLTASGDPFADFGTNTGDITHSHTDLYKVDVDTGHAQIVSGGTERLDTTWVVNDAGAVLSTEQYDQRNGHWRLRAGGPDGGRIAEAVDPARDIDVEGLGRTRGSVLVNRPAGADGDFKLIEYQAREGDQGVPPFGDEGIADELRDPATGLLIGGVTNSDNPKTILFDPALQTKFDKVKSAFAGEIVTLASATAALDRMVLFTQGPGDSGTYFLVDYPTRKIEAIAWAYPTILQGAVGVTKVVEYKAADGLAMQGILTLPPGLEAKRLPLVVMPHGGPEDRDYVTFDWWAQAFASRGYAVFQPNFRGSNGFGKAFRDAGYGQWGRKMQTDISDGVAELARQGLVDPKRACIVGGSYGGYAALAGVTVQQGLYRCAVAVAGIGDIASHMVWREEKFGDSNEVTRSDHLFLGVRSSGDASLKALSPTRLADRADAPVLLIHGKDDSTVPINQSWAMRDALRAADKPVEMIELPGEDHHLSKQATRVQMLQASVAFVEKYNPPSP